MLTTPTPDWYESGVRDRDGNQPDVFVGAGDAAHEAGSPDAVGASGRRDQYRRHPICADWDAGGGPFAWLSLRFSGEVPECNGPAVVLPDILCPDGQFLVDPLWVSRVNEAGEYGQWVIADADLCATDTDGLYAAAIDAWRSMDITPSGYEIQPDAGYAIASLGIVPIAEGGAQTRTVTLLGADVQLRATPQSFTWSTSDGDAWTATSPGATYENGGEPYVFDPGERRVQLTLVTEWTGEFSLNGGSTWIDAPGTATTTSDTTSIHVYSPRSRLVDCDLNGDCGSAQRAAPADVPTVLDPDGDGVDNYTVSEAQIAGYLAARQD